MSFIVQPASAGTFVGVLGVTQGGTNLSTLTAGNLLMGDGTNAVALVAPSTSGNVLASNGTAWISTTAAAGGTITATSTGSITAGNAVQINSNGTVSAPTVTYSTSGTTSATISATASNSWGSLIYLPLIDKYLITYYRSTDSYYVAAVGTPSASGAITWGTESVIYSGAGTARITSVYVSSQGNVFSVFNVSSSAYGVAISVSSSGVISSGSLVNIQGGTISNPSWYGLAYSPVVDRVMVTAMNNNTGGFLTSSTFLVVGNAITTSSTVSNIFSQMTNSPPYLVYDTASDKFLMIGAYTSNYMYCWIGTVAVGGATTWLSPQFLSTLNVGTYFVSTYSTGSAKSVIAFFPNDSTIRTATITVTGGTSVSLGTIYSFANNNTPGNPNISYDTGLDRIVYFYKNPSTYPSIRTGTISGTDISIGAETVIQAISVYSNSIFLSSYNSLYKYSAIAFGTVSNDFKYSAVTLGSSTLTTDNFIGFAENTVSTGQSTTVSVIGGANLYQSGLTPALKYYVQQTGALSTSVSTLYGGISLSATKLLVKG
jgi:hypothetical protein